jgi:hypothetical protein
MSNLTVIDVQRDAAPAVFDLLSEARISSTGFSVIDARGDATLKTRWPDLSQVELPEIGAVDIAGEVWDREARAGESLADFLFRRGLGRDAAARVQDDVVQGRLAVVVTDPQLDVRGARLALEREPRAEVLEAEVAHAPAESRRPEGTRAEVRQGDVRGFAKGGTRQGTP